MAVSTHADHFFQTTDSIADIERKKRKSSNTLGAPVRLSSKALALEVNTAYDPSGDTVFVAEAGGIVSAVRLSTSQVARVGKGASAPLCCLTSHASHYVHDPFVTLDVFAGGWEKGVTRYRFKYARESQEGRVVTDQITWKAHQDFVKCCVVAQTADGKPVLVTGGSDGEVNFWTVEEDDGSGSGRQAGATSPTATTSVPPKRLATLKPQARGIECLALDPYSEPDSPTLFISTSQREIFTVSIPKLEDLSSSVVQSTLSAPSLVHETSVYKLHFDGAGDLWTASADKTAKKLVRDNGWQVDIVLQHPDFVRDVVTHDRLPYVATACRDEEVRLWNSGTGELYHVFAGHYEEVTGLAVSNEWLISISIDATLRRWSLKPGDLQAEVERARNPNLLEDEPELSKEDVNMLTEEEEAELRALMEEEDEETMEQIAKNA